MKFIKGLLGMLLPVLSAAQPPPVKALTIGDTVPDITITNVYNYPASTIHLSDLKGKLVILDFWSTWCGTCIEAFPKMEKLQKEFGDQVQVILVNTFEGDTIKRVQSFFDKRQKRTGQAVELPYSLLQAPLAEYFPYRLIPHYVWIDKTGKVIATTSQTELTHDKISAALLGEPASIHNKIDLMNFDRSKPFLVNGNGGADDEFLYRSIFTAYIEGAGNVSGMQRDKDGNITRLSFLNAAPVSMLRLAYPDLMQYPPNRIIITAKDAYRYRANSDNDNLIYKNSFCYEFIMPPSSLEAVQAYLRQDLLRYLGVIVTSEKRNLKCLVLKKGKNLNKLVSKNGQKRADVSKASLNKYIKNSPLSTLIEFLNQLSPFTNIPLIDETGFSKKIDIDLPSDVYDLDFLSLKKFLTRSGFQVSEVERNIEVAVIRNK